MNTQFMKKISAMTAMHFAFCITANQYTLFFTLQMTVDDDAMLSRIPHSPWRSLELPGEGTET